MYSSKQVRGVMYVEDGLPIVVHLDKSLKTLSIIFCISLLPD